jgi:hypothetical protein
LKLFQIFFTKPLALSARAWHYDNSTGTLEGTMSGGHFQYSGLEHVADEIESIIHENEYDFSEEILDEFMRGVIAIKLANIYIKRIDWLISGDDGEESFHKRLNEDMNNV